MTEPMRILVVDDNQDLAINLQDILQENGYAASIAFDGKNAVALCRETPSELVILDYKLPDMNGLQLQKRLSEIISADYIIITAHASLESAASAVQRKQIVGYETKPLDFRRLLSFIQQVDDRRKAEADLRKSEARASALLNAIPDMMFRMDRNGVFLDFKPGNHHQPRSQMPYQDLLPPGFAEMVDDPVKKTLAGGTPQIFEYQWPIPDQGMKDYEARMVKSGDNEVTAIVRDVTSEKNAEKERIEMERRILKMQRLKSIGVMVGGIAHEFNNILMILLGNIEMAMEDAADLPRMNQFLEECRLASLRASSLVQQMMMYSGQGHPSASPSEISANVIIEGVAEMLRASMPPKASLNMALDHSIPDIEGDETQLRQVVINLVTNACESLDEDAGGTVTLSTGVESCDGKYLKQTLSELWMGYDLPLKEGPYVFLEVRDEGSGMGDDICRRIFEPFFTTKFQGRGLGLSAVLGIVRAHHGFIRVHSEPGEGTLIRILFPAVSDTTATVRPSASGEGHRGIARILVVDDEKPLCKLLQQVLEKLGYSVMTASGGAEAIALYQQHPKEIDAIILDLKMQGMTGIDVFDELRRLGCDAPMILSSGYTENEIRHYAGKGFVGFLQKPYQKESLRKILARIRTR